MHSKVIVFVFVLKFRFSVEEVCNECCNLVYRTRVHDWPESSRKIWGAHLEWHLDDHEMQTVVGRVDRYEIRHGKIDCWGGRIDERDASYATVPSRNASLTLHKLPLGYYGVQICSFNDRHRKDQTINWHQAWVGTIDVGNLNGHDKHSIRTSDIPISTCQSIASRPSINFRHVISLSIWCLSTKFIYFNLP